jgi:hypothetical protein
MMHLFARQNKERLECACSGLVLHEINDYLYQYTYEQLINAFIDEVNDGSIKTKD